MASMEYTKQFVSSLVLDRSPRVKLVDGAGKSEEWKRFKRVYIDGQPVEFAACVACMKTVLYKPKNGTNNMRGHRCTFSRDRKKSISLLEPKKEPNVRNEVHCSNEWQKVSEKCSEWQVAVPQRAPERNNEWQVAMAHDVPEKNNCVERPIAISIIPKLADMRSITILPVKEDSVAQMKSSNTPREEIKVHEKKQAVATKEVSMKPFVNQLNMLRAELSSVKNEMKSLRSRVTYLERENVVLKRSLIAATTPHLNSDDESGLLPEDEESIFKHVI